MKRKSKNIIGKIFLFLILVALVVFLFWFMKTRDEQPSPSGSKPQNPSESNIPSKPVDPNEPDTPSTPDPVGTSYLNNLTGKELSEDVKKIILEYMDVYYAAMKELNEKDMTYLFDNPQGQQALINQSAVSLLVQIRKMKPTDLTLSSAKYDLNIESVSKNGDTVKVILRESNYLRFNFMKEIESKVYNIENEFTLVKVNGQYKISKYNKVQDFFVMITDKYSFGGKSSLEKIKSDYLAIIQKNVENDKKKYADFLNGTGINRKTCSHGYDREKALTYAKSWVNKRNTSEWSRFDANCQNYASQVVYSGGIPMDYQGSATNHLQWKFYNASYNEKEVASGYIYTWTYVPYFYTYAKNNTGLGLCADVDVNIYYAEAGDIIHVGTNSTSSGPGRHALVSIGPYKKDDKVVDILVNSNTVDLENYPMSAYVYPYASLIKIYGYND